ncbi:hypothetical protein Tco_1196177 [Tanacetum coccineum]
MPEFNNNIAVSCCDVHLSSVLSDKVLYSWGDNEDVVICFYRTEISFMNLIEHFLQNENILWVDDAKVLCALVREWLKDLRDEAEQQLQAHLKFKRNILGSLNQICCNLFPSFNCIIDEFEPCQVPCHGYPLDDEHGNKLVKCTSCPSYWYAGGPTMAMIALKCPDIEVAVIDISVPRITAWNTDPYQRTKPI